MQLLLTVRVALVLAMLCLGGAQTLVDPLDTTVHIDAPASDAASFGPNTFVFGSNMVMACSDDHPEGARVFGKANAGETVTVTVLGASPAATAKTTANAGGNWELSLHVKASLTSYNISIDGSNQTDPVVLENVLFGDTVSERRSRIHSLNLLIHFLVP
jgi:hypothetical protein